MTGGLAGLLGRFRAPAEPPRHAIGTAPRLRNALPPALTAEQEATAAREREVIAAHAPCETAPNGTGEECGCDFACANYWLRAMRSRQVSWVPKAPRSAAAITMPMLIAPALPPVPAGPLEGAAPEPGKPLPLKIYEGMPALPPPPPPAGPETAVTVHTDEGWADLQTRRWLERGEWTPADSAVPAGLERNAAAMAVAQVRFEASVIDSLEMGCAVLGLPGLGSALWRRASEITRAAREAASAAGGTR